MHVMNRISRILDESPAEFKVVMLDYLRQHQAGKPADPACLFVAAVELQNQINDAEHHYEQLRQATADAEREFQRLDANIRVLQETLRSAAAGAVRREI